MVQRRSTSEPRRSLRPSYAARLTLRPLADADATPLYAQAVVLATEWLTEAARRQRVEVVLEDPAEPADHGSDAGSPPGIGDRGGWRGAIEHPHERARGVSLRTEVHVHPEPGGACLTLRRLIASAAEAPMAHALRIDRPSLVDDLLAAFAVSAGNLPMSMRPRRYRAHGIEALVRRLTDPDRVVPVVVVSKRVEGAAAVDAFALARRLAGIAVVVEFADFATAFELTERVGKALSCYDGAVRLYWPGFSSDDDRFSHPLWTAATIAQQALDDELSWLLLRQIGAAAARHLGLDRDLPAAGGAGATTRTDGLTRQLREAAESEAEWRELLEEASVEIQQLRDRIEHLERENGELWTTLAESPHWWQTIERSRERRDVEERRADLQQRIGQLRGLADAVRLVAEEHGGPHVEFVEAAFKSADKAPFQGPPQQVYAALAAVCAVAEQYHADRLNRPFKQAFEELGQDYRGNVSPTALGHYRSHYTFTSSKGKVEVGPHLAIGRGNPRTSLRIYWHVDDDERRFVVGHIGEHLPDTTT